MMKTFKFGLVGLLIGLFGFINFGSCGSYTMTGQAILKNGNLVSSIYNYIWLPVFSPYPTVKSTIELNCDISNFSGSVDYLPARVYYCTYSDVKSQANGCSSSSSYPEFNLLSGVNFVGSNRYYNQLAVRVSSNSNTGFNGGFSLDWSCTISGSNIYPLDMGGGNSCPDVSCPEVDTGAILSGYVSESLLNECLVDKNSCQSSISGYNISLSNCSNSLNTCNTNLNSCLQSNCGDIQWSALYINNIQHLSAPIINIDIPEEINWDYTGDENSFDINIEGYNVDTEYIEGIINTQNSKPNNQDFNNIIVGVLPLLIPGFVIIMFIYFIFRLIKKIF